MPPSLQLPSSITAQTVLKKLTTLQEFFRDGLNTLSANWGDKAQLTRSEWLRDQGQHGGGWRWGGFNGGILNRGSLNISSVHYDNLPEKRLASATALSCIVHPLYPGAPSLHTHISWTEMRDGQGGGWRLMADLNPSTPFQEDIDLFNDKIDDSLSVLSSEWLTYAKAQGDRYFWIPSLNRHRGASHYYLEQWSSNSPQQDLATAIGFGQAVIKAYLTILERAFESKSQRKIATLQAQIEYHSAYFLQVLTLDRGTSSGLLVHNQNDEGILGSLPQKVDRSLLESWIGQQLKPQDLLLTKLIACLPSQRSCELNRSTRLALAQVIREHYKTHPEALTLQARGDILPPTVANHSSERSIKRS
jgi:coproporphyrinogen III oxidase